MKLKIATIVFLIAICFFVPSVASAHQPRLLAPSQTIVTVTEPEVSKAYYGVFEGNQQIFQINAAKAFDFYLSLLQPKIKGYPQDLTAEVYQKGKRDKVLAMMMPSSHWTVFYEPFGGDYYYQGPEARLRLEAGEYEIILSGTAGNKFVAAIGERESFPVNEVLNTFIAIPQLKTQFFNRSISTSFFNYVGLTFLSLIIVSLIVFVICWRLLRRLVSYLRQRKVRPRN